MTLAEYQQLDYSSQLELADRAVSLMGRADEEHLILLYQLDGFYIEVFYHKVQRTFTAVRAFEDTEHLEPYLADMEINHFY